MPYSSGQLLLHQTLNSTISDENVGFLPPRSIILIIQEILGINAFPFPSKTHMFGIP